MRGIRAPLELVRRDVAPQMIVAACGQMTGAQYLLILDVRTPQEYYNGHLEGAKLIPLQQLLERLSEIQDYWDREILVYCRSGNRSTVAGELLIQKGFKKIYNLRPFICKHICNSSTTTLVNFPHFSYLPYNIFIIQYFS